MRTRLRRWQRPRAVRGASSERLPARNSTASRTVSGSGTGAPAANSTPRSPSCSLPLAASAAESSSTKNGTPSVRSCNAVGQARRGCRREHLGGERGSPGSVERAQHELAQPAGSAEVTPEPAQGMAPRHVVVAVDADHGHRQALDRLREHRHDVEERRLVSPLQIIQHDDRRSALPDGRERQAQRFEHGSGCGDLARTARARA